MTTALAKQQEYNLAQVVLIITNVPGTNIPQVTATFQVSQNGNIPALDPNRLNPGHTITVTNYNPLYFITNDTVLALPFLNLTNVFYDQRNLGNTMVSQIDVAAYEWWTLTNSHVQSVISSNSGNYPTILYVGGPAQHPQPNVRGASDQCSKTAVKQL